MAVKILDNDNVMFIGKDKDVLLSLNSEQRDLLMKVVNESTAHYKSHWVGSQFLSKQYITKYENTSAMIDHVKFSGPATIMFWKDGTKTIVKCTEEDDPNCETGIAMATLKKILGSDYVPYKKKVKSLIDEQIKIDLDALFKEIGVVDEDESDS